MRRVRGTHQAPPPVFPEREGQVQRLLRQAREQRTAAGEVAQCLRIDGIAACDDVAVIRHQQQLTGRKSGFP